MLNPEYKTVSKDGRTFAYHYSLVTAEGAEFAREISEYRVLYEQADNGDVNVSMRTGAFEWRFMVLRYLVREIINDMPANYDRGKCETDTDKFLRSLPDGTFDTFCTECLSDFFTNIKRVHLISTLLQSEGKINKLKLMNMMKLFAEKSRNES